MPPAASAAVRLCTAAPIFLIAAASFCATALIPCADARVICLPRSASNRAFVADLLAVCAALSSGADTFTLLRIVGLWGLLAGLSRLLLRRRSFSRLFASSRPCFSGMADCCLRETGAACLTFSPSYGGCGPFLSCRITLPDLFPALCLCLCSRLDSSPRCIVFVTIRPTRSTP